MNEKAFRRLEDEGRVLIDAARLDPEGETRTGETGDVLDLRSACLRPKGGIAYDLDIAPLGREILVRGSLRAVVEADCARCNRPFDLVVEVPDFAETFEMPRTDAGLDITDALREAVILESPAFPVHDPDCKGLCPKCGADLNDGPCACPPGTGDFRWSALDALR